MKFRFLDVCPQEAGLLELFTTNHQENNKKNHPQKNPWFVIMSLL